MYRSSRTGFPRVPFVQACTLEVGGVESTGVFCNLSLLGGFIDVEPQPEPRREGTLRFLLPDGGTPIVTPVRVAWVHEELPEAPGSLPRGCGVRFKGLTADEVRRVGAIVEAFHEDPRPSGVDREPERTTRIPFVAQCALAGPGGIAKGRVCNVSARGIYVAVEPVPDLGTKLIAAFPLPGVNGLFERVGIVAWRNVEGMDRVRVLPIGCGVNLVNLSAEDQQRLQSLVDSYIAGLPTDA